jgi:hypothetical protein
MQFFQVLMSLITAGVRRILFSNKLRYLDPDACNQDAYNRYEKCSHIRYYTDSSIDTDYT